MTTSYLSEVHTASVVEAVTCNARSWRATSQDDNDGSHSGRESTMAHVSGESKAKGGQLVEL